MRPPATVDTNEQAQKAALTAQQEQKRLDADKAREAKESQKKKERPPPPAHRARHEKSAPFVNGGSAYDPLNGAL